MRVKRVYTSDLNRPVCVCVFKHGNYHAREKRQVDYTPPPPAGRKAIHCIPEHKSVRLNTHTSSIRTHTHPETHLHTETHTHTMGPNPTSQFKGHEQHRAAVRQQLCRPAAGPVQWARVCRLMGRNLPVSQQLRRGQRETIFPEKERGLSETSLPFGSDCGAI